MPSLRVACIQICAGPDVAQNLAMIAPLLREANQQGAELIALPENTVLMAADPEIKAKGVFTEATHPALPFFCAQAQALDCWILIGSLWIKTDGAEKHFNRSYLIDPLGQIVTSYDKIHLFDATAKAGEHYAESNSVIAGDRAVLASTPFGKLGLTICYDLRFPHLFRDLAKAGAAIIFVPAAFTVPTGEAHWESLLRSRAIETGSFIVAPAQCGEHHGGRRTYGHSLIIDPWGKILAAAGELPEIICVDLELEQVSQRRMMLPSLSHDRAYHPPESLAL
jgi:deaminated glutathione amidase